MGGIDIDIAQTSKTISKIKHVSNEEEHINTKKQHKTINYDKYMQEEKDPSIAGLNSQYSVK